MKMKNSLGNGRTTRPTKEEKNKCLRKEEKEGQETEVK